MAMLRDLKVVSGGAIPRKLTEGEVNFLIKEGVVEYKGYYDEETLVVCRCDQGCDRLCKIDAVVLEDDTYYLVGKLNGQLAFTSKDNLKGDITDRLEKLIRDYGRWASFSVKYPKLGKLVLKFVLWNIGRKRNKSQGVTYDQ